MNCVSCHAPQPAGTPSWKTLCVRCYIISVGGNPDARRRTGSAPRGGSRPDPIAAELAEHLPRLIRLCHPDRHAGSEASTKATQWLLGLRGKL